MNPSDPPRASGVVAIGQVRSSLPIAARLASENLVALPSSDGFVAEVVRRAVDVIVSLVALVACAPIVTIAAFVIRFDTPGRALFRQVRVGRDGRLFCLVKLRGMWIDARERFPELYDYTYSEDAARTLRFHQPNDPRVTPAGRFFRRTSLDELPNFWNVLVGDMSLVGPRPQIPEMFAYYGTYRDVILSVKPGIFSLPKVISRDNMSLHETILLDAYYVHHRSLWLDLKILARGIAVVLTRKAVH